MSRWSRGPIIGRGSSATVSTAVIRTSGEVLAVKSAEITNYKHLQREQELLSSLSSPHIVGYRGFDVTRENSNLLCNLFMEFCPRGTLRDEMDRHGGKLSEAAISEYTYQVVSGLAYLHSKGVVHCDLKPRNILIGDDGAKISDFGCSKREKSTSTAAGEGFGGTPLFTAPEVARGEEQGFRSDVWALGCTVIEMATGKAPWADSGAVLHRIAYSEESPAIPSNLTEQARDFLGKCLSRDPKQRWTPRQLLKHPFLAESTTSDASKQPNSWSPTCVLDDHEIWSSLEETEPPCVRTIPEISDEISIHRVQRMSLSSGPPDWTWEEDWITSRGNSGDLQEENEDRLAFGENFCMNGKKMLLYLAIQMRKSEHKIH